MKKTKALISSNLEQHPHFEEYFKIIGLIEGNELVNPDICIESCKALIEGVSKTIIVNLDEEKELDKIDGDNIPKLFKTAMKILAEKSEDLEGDFVSRFTGIIQTIGEIRNKRGDISHGRAAPKPLTSTIKLATVVVAMTESMLSYILEHYFQIEHAPSSALIYQEENDYNNWLDESVDFPIAKAKYSKVLYDLDYDEYETRYDEFLQSKEGDEKAAEPFNAELVETEDEVEKPKTEEFEKPEDKEDVSEPASLIEKKKTVVLASDFNPETFWTEKRNRMLIEFCKKEKLNLVYMHDLINDYLFSGKQPLRDTLRRVMVHPPHLLKSTVVLNELGRKIVAFVDDLNT